MSKEVMHFRGKPITNAMSKGELLEIIVFLASQMNEYKSENDKYHTVIYEAKIKELGIL